MLPELMMAMSACASARMASATRSPRFVSEVRRCRLTPSSGTRVVPTTVSSAVPSRDSYDGDDAGRLRIVGERAGDRHQLVEALDRARRPLVDVDARDELRVRARLADERPVARSP